MHRADSPAELCEALEHVIRRPGMWGVSTHSEAITLLIGVDLATGWLPTHEMTDWLLKSDDPRWGRPGGPGWPHRVVYGVVYGDAWPKTFRDLSPEQEVIAREAVLRTAIDYLQGKAPSA
jgi:hypothetical protein